MTILKIGEHYFNMAHFVHASFGPTGVKLVFNAPMGGTDWVSGAYEIRFKGTNAEAVRAFLHGREMPKGGEL